MYSFLHGVPWVHIAPAIIAVIVGLIYLKQKSIYLKVIFGILWLLLLPNSAYIFIDIERIFLHWNSLNVFMQSVLILQYLVLELIGLVSFLLAMLPLENIFKTWHIANKSQIVAIIILNFFIGFGIVLGRTGYTNSYIVLTNPLKVFFAAMHIVTSINLLGLAVLLGIVCSCIYFIFRKTVVSYTKKLV